MPETLKDTQGYKNSLVGKIPKDWDVYTLESCVRPDAQITYGIVQAGPYIENGIPYIRTGDMAGDRLTLQGLLRTSPQIAASYRRSEVRAGEIVCAIRATVGKVLEVPQELDGANLTQGTARIAPRDEINNHFLLWALKSDYVKKQFTLAIKGTTFSEITLENLRKIQIALPSSKSEQNQIAEILDTIDSTIAHTSALIAKLKQMKAGLLHDLLTRGLDENGKLRDAIEHPEQFKDSPLGQIPKNWDVGNFEKLADAIDPQPDHRAPPEVQDGKPYVGVGDFRQDGSIDFDSCRKVSPAALAKQQQRFRIEPGDIIFGKIGTIGLPRFLPQGLEYALNANTVLIKPKTCPSYVMSLLNSKIVEQQIQLQTHSTSQPAFGIQRIRAMLAPIPNESEQFQITAVLDSHEERIRTEETYLNKLKEQKKGLMHDLLTGRVRVTDLKEIPA